MNTTIKVLSRALVTMLFAICINMQYQSNAYAEEEKDEGTVLDFMSAFLAAFGGPKNGVLEICKTGQSYDVICDSGQDNFFVVFIDEGKEVATTTFITPDGGILNGALLFFF